VTVGDGSFSCFDGHPERVSDTMARAAGNSEGARLTGAVTRVRNFRVPVSFPII
jgi:hypothetical protein